MFVVTYWYLFLIIGVLFTGYAVWRQVKRMRDLMDGTVTPFAKDMGFFDGIVLQMMAGLLGSVSILIGFIGLIIGLVRG